MAGMMCGLLASALAPAASSAPMILIMLIVPQIVLGGALVTVPTSISQFASTRWGFEGLMGISGMGSMIVADPCWQLEPDLRKAMTLAEKESMGCQCMGVSIFKEGSCTFPGVGQFYALELDAPAPIPPEELGPRPAEPEMPTPSEPPSNQDDQVAAAQYFNSLQEYQNQVKEIQEEYKSLMSLYEAQASIFQVEMEEYQKALFRYETVRNASVEMAEGLIDNVTKNYGWTWVNKEDPQVFRAWLLRTWGAQLMLVGAYIMITMILIKRKDIAR
jgi:hypothetical protein